MQALRLLMLSLMLLLAFQPDSSPFVHNASGQEVCVEEIYDIEEEAVIQTTRQEQKKLQPALESLVIVPGLEPVVAESCFPSRLSFERHWLTCRKLRL